MANTGVDGGLMQKGMEMAVARNGGKYMLLITIGSDD